MRDATAWVAVAFLVGTTAVARGDDTGPLGPARAAKDAVDYERALAEVDRVLEAGDLSLDDTRAALILRGEFLAVLGRAAEATDTFADVLASDPDTRIDPDLAPRVHEAFAAAARRQPGRVSVSCSVGAQGTLIVRLEPGASTRARFVRVERRSPAEAPARQQVTAPLDIVLPRERAEIACFAVDVRGNALAAGPGWDRPLEWSPGGGEAVIGAVTSAPPSADDEARPLWRNPWLWGGAAVIAAGAGVTFSYLAHRDQERLDELTENSETVRYSRAMDVLERGESRTRWSRGFYVAAGVLAVGAVVCIFFPRRRAPRDRVTTSLTISPAGVGVWAEF